VSAAGLPLGKTPLPAEADDAANPYGFRPALDAKGVDFRSRAERATSRSSTARGPPGASGNVGAGHTRGGGSDTAREDPATAGSGSPSWRAVSSSRSSLRGRARDDTQWVPTRSPSRSSPRGRTRDDAQWVPSRSPLASASTTRTRSPGRGSSRRATRWRWAPSPLRPRAGPRRSGSPTRPPRRTQTPPPGRGMSRHRRGPTP